MGQIISSCHLDCCTDGNDKPLNNNISYISDSEGEDKDLAQIEYSRYCLTENPKTSIEFPLKQKNLFHEHFTDPWSYYKEIKVVGEGAYGVVKKVCLKNDPDTLRAMKIIPKEI